MGIAVGARTKLRDWSKAHPHCAIVFTSRTAGFVPIPDFVEARIQPLDGTRQKSLLQNWLGAGWDDAWRALEDRPSLVSLCTNPMLLSLVAYSHRMGDGDTTLPRTRCGG